MLETLIPPELSVTETRESITRKKEIPKDACAISTVREQVKPNTLADFSTLFRMLLAYRLPMTVQDAILLPSFPDDNIYYRCPRCQCLLERELLVYCSSCGQCLDWRNYRKAKQTRFRCKQKSKA